MKDPVITLVGRTMIFVNRLSTKRSVYILLLYKIQNHEHTLEARDFSVTSLSIYDFSTLCTILPIHCIKNDFFERTFHIEGSPYLPCNDRNVSFILEQPLPCQNVCANPFVGQNFIRSGTKLYRRVVGIPMSTNCAHQRRVQQYERSECYRVLSP